MPTLVVKNIESSFTCRYPFQEESSPRKPIDLTLIPQQKLWEVWIEGEQGDFDPNDSYEVSVGYEPDCMFTSHPFFANDDRIRLEVIKKGTRKPIIQDELFAQTFGNSILFLRRYGANDDGVVLLKVPVVNTVPDGKKGLFSALTAFFYHNARGYFLIDSIHGQTKDNVSQVFHFGYSSFNDPERELFSIEQVLTSDSRFRIALLGVLRNPDQQFVDVDCPKRFSKIRRVSPSAFRRKDTNNSIDPIIWSSVRSSSFESPCNNAIATFLDTLLRRLDAITRHFESFRTRSGGSNQKDWERRRDAREETASTDVLNRCTRIRRFLLRFLTTSVFAFSERRRESIFRVFPSCHSKSPSYHFVLNKIYEYALTNFYWTGDPSPLFRQPAYIHADDGRNTWIRKYSMLYEFWCYMRLHQTLCDLNFRTNDIPQNGQMQTSSYVNGNLKVIVYHDVRDTDKTVPIELQCGGKTPDFALIFQNLQSQKLALVILDAKSNDDYASHIPEIRNNYLNHCRFPDGSEHATYLKMRQSWILLSGDDCPSFVNGIECPPVGLHGSSSGKRRNQSGDLIDELACEGTDDSFRHGKLKKWLTGLRWDASGFTPILDNNQTCTGGGYLFTHIKRTDSFVDTEETDRFKLFLEAQVKLMEKVLA